MFGLSLRERSLLYFQLAQALDSGIAAASALRLLDGSGAAGRGAAAAAAIARGQTLVAAFDTSYGLPLPHRLALQASERAGRLPACLRQLSSDLDAERAQRRQFWISIAYPMFLLHVLVPLTSTPLLLTKPGLFATRVVAAWAILWAMILGGAWFHRRGTRSPRYMHALQGLPLIGPAVRHGAFVRFFRSLVELYGSGVQFTEAIGAARSVLGDAPPLEDFSRAAAAARGGATMEGVFATLTSLDPLLRSLLQTSATTGDLENGLRKVIRDLEERWRDAMQRFLSVTSRLLYFAVATVVAWSVISHYSGYYSGIASEYEQHTHHR